MCGEECFCHPLRRDVALHAQADDHAVASGEGGSCDGDHRFTRGAPFVKVPILWLSNRRRAWCSPYVSTPEGSFACVGKTVWERFKEVWNHVARWAVGTLMVS